jgi:hypothetical protein
MPIEHRHKHHPAPESPETDHQVLNTAGQIGSQLYQGSGAAIAGPDGVSPPEYNWRAGRDDLPDRTHERADVSCAERTGIAGSAVDGGECLARLRTRTAHHSDCA